MDEKTKILIVEDEESLSSALTTHLNKTEKYEVKTAGDGQEALSLVEWADLVLSDIVMPQLGGLEFLDKIRSDAKLADKKVIMLTNLDRGVDRQTAKDLNVSRYIVKSQTNLKDIVDIIDEVVAEDGIVQQLDTAA